MKFDATEMEYIQRAAYRYIDADGSVRKAVDLLEVLRNARDGYYLLGDYCGRSAEPISGDIWYAGTNTIDVIAQFTGVKLTTHEQLVNDFYRECLWNHWVLMPTNKETYEIWSQHKKSLTDRYVVRNQIAVFDSRNTITATRKKNLFWYRSDSGMIKKARSMSEMLNNAKPDYYMLGECCSEGKFPAGQIKKMGTDVYLLFSSLVTEVGDFLFEDFKISNKRMLVREFNDLCGRQSNWVLSPISGKDYIYWLNSKGKEKYYFVKRGWRAEIIKGCCEFCNV
jgi:hypothetical protein